MYTENYIILAQSNPAATTLINIYTVGASKRVVISSVVVCNMGGVATTFRVSLADSGAADDPKQYLYYDVPIPANDTFVATIGITLTQTDVVRVYAGNANLAFNLLGTELTVA